MSIFNENPFANLSSKSLVEAVASVEEQEEVRSPYRLHVVQWLQGDNGELYPVNVPFGLSLELSPKQRKAQGSKSLALSDALLAIARSVPEGEYKALTPKQLGAIGVIVRHSGPRKSEDTTEQTALLAQYLQTLG